MVTIISSIWGILYNYVTFEEAVSIVSIFGMIVLVLGMVDIILAIGLTLKQKSLWKFSIYFHLILAWTIVGLVICRALSEKDVKGVFERDKKIQ